MQSQQLQMELALQNNSIGGVIIAIAVLFIMGAMKIAQRGTNFTGDYSIQVLNLPSVDRFLFHVGSLGTWTLSQSTDVPTGQGLSA